MSLIKTMIAAWCEIADKSQEAQSLDVTQDVMAYLTSAIGPLVEPPLERTA